MSLVSRLLMAVLVTGLLLAACLIVTLSTVLSQHRSEALREWGSQSATAVAPGPDGTLYVSYLREIYRLDPASGRLQLMAGRLRDPAPPQPHPVGGSASGAMIRPVALAVGAEAVYFVDQRTDQAQALKNGQIDVLARGSELGGVAVDNSGDLYVSDRLENRVLRVDARSGQSSTIAGTGEAGFGGDKGPGDKAQLEAPQGLALDRGRLLIADTGNQRIRSLDLHDGIIQTVAGDGRVAFSGDGGPAVKAHLADPVGVAVGSGGGFYIADAGNHRVREVNKEGTITTFAGSGQPGIDPPGATVERADAHLRQPISIAVLPGGQMYLVDDFQLRLIDSNGISFVVPPEPPM